MRSHQLFTAGLMVVLITLIGSAVPASAAQLAAPDRTIVPSTWETGAPNGGGALHRITTKVIGADELWRRGYSGQGIGVALIDSGIAPVRGLDAPGKVLNGPDLSFDGGNQDLRHLDAYGHGTHLAGIIAGSDPGAASKNGTRNVGDNFSGVAPGAHLVNVKVADGSGTADVSQVIAGINWVIEHKNDPGANIRVLNLSFGTDSIQDYQIDPLAHAVEQAWRAGIVVVAAAGNDSIGGLRNPASDPFVIAVGAVDAKGTRGTGDDELLTFSNCGTIGRPVDIVAPGLSVSSLRVPGSFVDSRVPGAADGDRFFRGTGTSQSTAIVSGAVALLLDQRPDLTPDEVKALLVSSGRVEPGIPDACGDRMLDLASAVRSGVPADSVQAFAPSDGSGSLEAARGTFRVFRDGEPLIGEVDVTGGTWSGGTWSGGTWSGGTWSGGTWSGGTWSGGTWSAGMWQGLRWR